MDEGLINLFIAIVGVIGTLYATEIANNRAAREARKREEQQRREAKLSFLLEKRKDLSRLFEEIGLCLFLSWGEYKQAKDGELLDSLKFMKNAHLIPTELREKIHQYIGKVMQSGRDEALRIQIQEDMGNWMNDLDKTIEESY